MTWGTGGQGGDAENSSNMASSSSVAGGGTDLLGLGLASEERQHPTPLPEPTAAVFISLPLIISKQGIPSRVIFNNSNIQSQTSKFALTLAFQYCRKSGNLLSTEYHTPHRRNTWGGPKLDEIMWEVSRLVRFPSGQMAHKHRRSRLRRYSTRPNTDYPRPPRWLTGRYDFAR